ncbi:Gfo/Idh/MocA family protein [Lachnoclostridium sp.]|uniref:Gfo/Idh/MocA family protein n=1 Tax=Lachnoclostridium sp. TaxID=2028282 RepID=UPI0028968085|nr:Gfo/Idh/MocA family oxidoreductase [Lachnoclostridium sp.]
MNNIAILGAGRIASFMAKTVNGMNDVNLYGIASRDLSKAEEFAKEFSVDHAYGSYEEMLQDPNIDLVYIATPHSHHYEHAKLCLQNGKNVLCEKAFTANKKQAEEILSLAKEKGLLITEAIWTRYMPIAQILKDVLHSGKIGTPASLISTFGALVSEKPRLREPSLAGGALLDLGIYPLTFALIAFGNEISDIKTSAVLTDLGVDETHSVILTYKDGKVATLCSSMISAMESQAIIYGTKGYLKVYGMNNYEKIEVYNSNRELVETIERPEQITGYEYEVTAALGAISEGKLECPEMPHEETLRVMEIMDGLRASWGVHYPFD